MGTTGSRGTLGIPWSRSSQMKSASDLLGKHTYKGRTLDSGGRA